MRAVLDPNVIISGWLSTGGAPARILEHWRTGSFEMIASPELIRELERVVEYPKIRKRIPPAVADAGVQSIFDNATVRSDPVDPPPVKSDDPGDDYLISLAAAGRALLVSGDKHLLALGGKIPVYAPSDFLALLD